MLLSFAVCLLVVYNIRKTSGDNAWKIAVITGSIVNMIVLLFISIDINVNLSPILVIIGTVISALLAVLIEFFAFPVDYSRTEYLQFEDDEYYYYVKAVPKLTVAAPKKTVKKINERQETRSLKVETVKEFPVEDTAHTVIVLRKIAPTPTQYPRRYAKIKQAPL